MNLYVETFCVSTDLQKSPMFCELLGSTGGWTFPTRSMVNHSSWALAWCSVGFKPCSGNSFSHQQLNLLISAAQEQQQHRVDTSAPTYHRAVFRNPPPRVIYLNTDTTDRALHIPAYYCVTQTGLFALLLQIRRMSTTTYDISRQAERSTPLLESWAKGR